jgi:hypothetical protein
LDRLEEARLVEPPFDAERDAEVERRDDDDVEARHADDRVDGLYRLERLDLHPAGDLRADRGRVLGRRGPEARVGHERAPPACPVRRVAHERHAALDVLGRAHHREGDALGAGVQGDLHLAVVDGRHADERRARRARRRGDHGVHRLAADRPVLAVDKQEVGAGRGDRLRGHGRWNRAQDAVEHAILAGEPLAQEHRSGGGDGGQRVLGRRELEALAARDGLVGQPAGGDVQAAHEPGV